MIKRKIAVAFFILNMFFLKSVFGQAQVITPDYIKQKFQSYCNSVIREEIFIHTDREEYISGEDLWFNVYLIDRQSFKPSSNSKIAYVEILNPENRPIVQKRILLDKGFGPGQLVLPDTLSSGTYTVRAYTSWMKNFLPYNCFLKDIKVYNSLRTKTFRRSVRSFNTGETATDTLPVNSDLTLKVNNLKHDSLEIFVYADEKFRSENENQIFLLIQTHGIINYLTAEKVSEEITRFAVPKNSITTGINQITVFDSKGPVTDRFIYTPTREKQVSAINLPGTYKQRDKVLLEFEIGDESSDTSDRSDFANLSISVASGTISQEITDLNDYLVFGTEFGFFPWRTIEGKKISELPSEILDSLLSTVESNWINWEKVFSTKAQLFKYPLEKEFHYITGRLLTSNLQPVSTDEILLMSTPGREAVFQYTGTDADGNFNFRIYVDEEPKDLILQPDIFSKNQKIYVESSFSNLYPQTKIFVDSTNGKLPSLISRQIINYQVRTIYGSSSTGYRITPSIPAMKPERFYGKPDFELVMSNYIRLDSMQEVFFELIPRVALEYNNSVYELVMTDPLRNKIDGKPLIMIDGVIINDLSVIANLDPEIVEKIDVVWDKYRVGGYLFNGIINIISKTGDFSSGTIPADAIRLHYNVIDTVCSFLSPDYSSNEMKRSRIADFRNTLYWNPSVKHDKNGIAAVDFWTADIKSEYIISINGITPDGKIVSLRKSLKVK